MHLKLAWYEPKGGSNPLTLEQSKRRNGCLDFRAQSKTAFLVFCERSDRDHFS